ncbi:hypothetical protein ACLMJK_006089 [Lecanora helva]
MLNVPGGAFQRCVSCELESETFNRQTGQTNLGWAFYNMRYAVGWCLYDYPRSKNETITSTCSATCAPIANALETNILTPNASMTYDFCHDTNFQRDVGACASCYQIISNQLYISNFLKTLQYACQTQPTAAKPFYIKPTNVFTLNPPSDFSNITAAGTPPQQDGLSHHAKIALVISIPVGAFVILSLLFVWLFVSRNRSSPKNNRRSYYNEKHISKASAGWNQPPRKAFDQTRHGTASPRPVSYVAPLNPQKVAMPAPLRPQKSHSPIPFTKAFGSPMYEQPMPPPLQSKYSKPSIPFLPPTKYSPPRSVPEPQRKKSPTLSPRPKTPQRPPAPPSGLVSWERIAIQNARIRASQVPSPSPVSPLTKPQVVQIPPRQPSVLSRNTSSPFRHDSPFRTDTPFRQDSLIPLSRQDSQPILRRPSSSTLGTTYLLNQPHHRPRRHRSKKSKRSSDGIAEQPSPQSPTATDPQTQLEPQLEPQPPRRQGTPGQGEMLKTDAPPVPAPYDTHRESPMMPLSPIRPLSPILKSSSTQPQILRPQTRRGERDRDRDNRDTFRSDFTTTTGTTNTTGTLTTGGGALSALIPRSNTTTSKNTHRSNPSTATNNTFSTALGAATDDSVRSDTPNPDDGILSRRSGGPTGRMRSGSGRSRGERKEVRWSKDVDYEGDGWGGGRKSGERFVGVGWIER